MCQAFDRRYAQMQILQHRPGNDPGLVSFPVSGNQALTSCHWMDLTERPGNKHLHTFTTLGRFPIARSRQGAEGVDAGIGALRERMAHLAVLEPH